MEVDIIAEGVHASSERFRKLGKRATDARPAMRKIASDLMQDERELFVESPWTALRTSTRRRKARDGEDHRIMRGGLRTIRGVHTRSPDALYRALTMRKQPGQELTENTQSLKFGLLPRGPVFYGVFHQKPRRGEPQRTLLEMTPRKAKRAADRIRDHLLKD